MALARVLSRAQCGLEPLPVTVEAYVGGGLPAPNRALRATENPRVDGSIPSLATTSNSMI
jgi:hypothetical protein